MTEEEFKSAVNGLCEAFPGKKTYPQVVVREIYKQVRDYPAHALELAINELLFNYSALPAAKHLVASAVKHGRILNRDRQKDEDSTLYAKARERLPSDLPKSADTQHGAWALKVMRLVWAGERVKSMEGIRLLHQTYPAAGWDHTEAFLAKLWRK